MDKKPTDECYTTDEIWDDLQPYMPQDKVLYDPFNGDRFVRWARSKNLRAIAGHDFWGTKVPDDCCVVSNPPFSARAETIHTLLRLGVPFILLVPYSTLRMNIMNAMPHFKLIMWGGDIFFQYPDGGHRRCRQLALCNKIDIPRINWIPHPLKIFSSYLCACGSLVQKHHRGDHERQTWHLDRAQPLGEPNEETTTESGQEPPKRPPTPPSVNPTTPPSTPPSLQLSLLPRTPPPLTRWGSLRSWTSPYDESAQ